MNLSDEKLTLEHFQEISPLIKRLQPVISEYSFANLYLFRTQHDYRVLRHNGHLFLQGITYDGVRYLMPFTPLEEIEEGILKEFMQKGFSLFPVQEEKLGLFSETEYTFTYNDNDSDYIYTKEKIATLPGRYLHKKRNLIKQYRTLYQYTDKTYTCLLAEDAKTVLQKWFDLGNVPVEDTDFVACTEAIDHCAALTLSGQMYYADGEPTGFLLGEELSSNMFVIHFAKGVTTFKGIYPHMYNSLAGTLPDQYELLNFEQDLGNEGLRQAKSTYIQDQMLKKFRVSLK